VKHRWEKGKVAVKSEKGVRLGSGMTARGSARKEKSPLMKEGGALCLANENYKKTTQNHLETTRIGKAVGGLGRRRTKKAKKFLGENGQTEPLKKNATEGYKLSGGEMRFNHWTKEGASRLVGKRPRSEQKGT